MDTNIKESLRTALKPYRLINHFSEKPGIYALGFCGGSFPLKNYSPELNEIIYIGKTESSQKSRDRDTHFKDGKTGSSTLRRTFGALLLKELNLTPIPRTLTDVDKGRVTKFKFSLEDGSERRLSNWMQDNLSLSFFGVDGPVSEIDTLETQLIQELTPILNIDRKNPSNPFAVLIKAERKRTGLLAQNQHIAINEQQVTSKKNNDMGLQFTQDVTGIHKYEDIWEQLLPTINSQLERGQGFSVSLNRALFDAVGNRQSYSFKLEINDQVNTNNIGGTAVARDLYRVLSSNSQFQKLSKGKWLVFRLSSGFQFSLSL